MIVIIISIVVVLSTLLTAFLTFSPNFAILVDKDFMRRAETRAFYAAHAHGQINSRTGDLAVGGSYVVNFPLRWRNDGGVWGEHDHMRATVMMDIAPTGGNNITVNFTHVYGP